MTASANTIQYNGPEDVLPDEHRNPKEVPNDNATVPTMTHAATMLRVMNIMIEHDQAHRCDPGDHKSYLAPS